MLLDSLDCTYYVKLQNNIIFVLLKFNDGFFLSSHVFTLLISLVMISSSRFKFSPEQKILVSSANKTRLVDQEPGTEEQTDQQGLGSRQASQTGRDRQREADRWIRSRGQRSRQTDRGWAAGKIVRPRLYVAGYL